MANLTYTAQGTFNASRRASINVCIPAEPRPGDYPTEMYNLSKNTSNGVINVIFCHFSDGSSTAMHHSSFDFRLNFDLNKLNIHSGAVPFDENNPEALFIFFHNGNFNASDRSSYFSEIESIYDEVKNNGNQSQDGIANTVNAAHSNPRKVGMSLVVKTS
ncbi:hypothetical protein [Flavobacterium sp. SM2513]|uniref:hypothetical protein n=1 Tax=Flavobacterium sp. SM2513 TaxID=3424766 RepID=UPI003D7F30A5